MMLPLKLCVVLLLQVSLSLQHERRSSESERRTSEGERRTSEDERRTSEAERSVSSACSNSPYRTYNGSCNNLGTPSWGAANTPLVRIVNPKYADGKSAPPLATDGSELPNARLLSLEVFQEGVQNSPEFSLANMQFGQVVAHDMAFSRGGQVPCCANGRLQPNRDQRCFAIAISPEDPVFSARGIECLNMVRTLTTCDENPNECKQAEQFNTVTHFLDLSLVYGNSVEEVQSLREPNTGFLKVETRAGQDWPPRHPNASTSCTLRTPADACYLTGDRRANQSPHLVIFQIAFVREHNRIARQLKALNPTWNPDKLFEEARRINIAEYQHIVYTEWLPAFLGRNYMIDRKLLYQAAGPINDYSRKIDPSVINSFTTGAFRFFHSSIQGILKLYAENRITISKVDINDHTNNPSILEQASDRYADLLRGLTTQPMGLNDMSLDPATKHFLLRFNNMFGTDLKSLDIQRGRDHGLGGYNDFVYLCFNQRATNWEDYNKLLVPGAVDLLSIYYKSVDDLDLSVGLAFEKKVDGTESGRVTQCILADQFRRTRKGDRFFYENGNHFNTRQLNEIRKANIARILCDTSSGDVSRIQRAAFVLPSNINPLVSCNTLPTPNLGEF